MSNMTYVVRGQSSVWRGYRILRGMWCGLFLGAIPIGALLTVVPGPSRFLELLLFVDVAAFGIVNLRWLSWPCPRCGEPIKGQVRSGSETNYCVKCQPLFT